MGNEFSGWLVLTIPPIQEGLILLNIGVWYGANDNSITRNWTTVNNEGSGRRRRQLKKNDMTKQPETMEFEYAIDGQITTLKRDEFKSQLKHISRTNYVITLLNDPNYNNDKDVEIAIRMKGCGRQCTFGLSHVYFA